VRVLGIDPGQAGAYALLGEDVKPLAEPFPTRFGVINWPEVYTDWKCLAPDVFVLERPQAMPKMSRSSSMHFGQACGLLEGIALSLCIETGARLERIQPQAWKRLVLAGTARDKEAAIAWAVRAFPGISLVRPGCRKAHDGMADALAIADYGRRTFGAKA
jgi:hypothetical protein